MCVSGMGLWHTGSHTQWVHHSVPQGKSLRAACAIHPTHPVRLVVQLFCLHCSLVWCFISPVGTMVQIMPGLHRVIDMRQIREYPDSTISKVLTILKWRMITTLNRKLLEKQRVQNRFASYEVHIGHFFYNVNATVSF